MDEPLFVRHPAIGLLMARYIAGFAVTELLVSAAFSRLIGDDGTATHAIFHRFRNVSERIDTLKEFANLSNAKEANPVLALIEAIGIANKRRNILAHGLWLEAGDGALTILTNLTEKQRKQTKTAVDEPTLSDWLGELNELNKSMFSLGFSILGVEHGLKYG